MKPHPIHKHQNNGQEGQSLILFALFVPVLIAMSGFILDLGYAYAQHRFLQNASDAAALHAVQDIVNRNYTSATSNSTIVALKNVAPPPGTTPNVIFKYNDTAGATSASVAASTWTITPTASTRTVWVMSTQTQPTFVMRVLGFSQLSEWAEAYASIYVSNSNVYSEGNAFPICLETSWISTAQAYLDANGGIGTEFTFWDPQNTSFNTFSTIQGQSWKGSCNIAGMGNATASDIASLAYFTGTITIGEQLRIIQGSTANNISSAMQSIVSSQGLTDAVSSRTCPITGNTCGVYGYFVLPVVSSFTPTSGSDGYFTVSNFAKVKVYYGDIGSNKAAGYFVNLVSDGTTSIGSTITITTPVTFRLY